MAFQKRNNEKEDEVPIPDNQELRDLAKKDEAKFNALMLRDKDLLDDAMRTGIRHGMFWNQKHKEMFGLIAKYFANHQSLLTRTSFETILDQNSKLSDEVKAQFRLLYDDLYQIDVKPDDYSFLKESIEGRELQRQMIYVLKRCDQIHTMKSGIRKMVEEIQRMVSGIRGVDAETFIRTQTLGQTLIEEVWPEIQQRCETPELFKGIMSGFPCIDEVYNGFLPGKYMVISGRPSGGKTTLMLNLAVNMAVAGRVVIFVTIEDDLKKTSARALTIHTEINYNRIMRGGKDQDHGLSDTIMKKLKEGIDNITTMGEAKSSLGDRLCWIEALQNTRWSVIQSEINKIMSYNNVDVLFVDYLDVVGKDVSYPSRPDLELADTSAKIQAFGKRTRILTATAQQLRSEKVREFQKKGMSVDSFKPGVGDISGTAKIAGAADYIFGIWMDEDNQDRMHLYSTKSRHTKALQRFMLSMDCNSGRLEAAPNDFDSVEKYVQEHKEHAKEIIAETHDDVQQVGIEQATSSKIIEPVMNMWPYSEGGE